MALSAGVAGYAVVKASFGKRALRPGLCCCPSDLLVPVISIARAPGKKTYW